MSDITIIREKEPASVLLAIVIALAAVGTFMFIVVLGRIQALQEEVALSNIPPVDISGWATYHNDQYGFEIEYPAGWQLLTAGLTSDTPYLVLGNPPTGIKTYAMQIFIENNPNMLSSGSYVHALLTSLRAEDAANKAAVSAPQPQLTPSFEKTFIPNTAGYPAYELYKVFEFDHNAERIYIAHGTIALRFDFPIAEENPNLSLPVANNGVAHNIINTLVFSK